MKVVSENRKAYHDYEILEKYTAGIALTGTEIKSVRAGKVNLKDGYADIDKEEVWLNNVHISPYEKGTIYNHEPLRKRKLLMTKQEIKRLMGKIKEGGLTLVPLKVFIDRGWAKVELGLAKGKKLHDKRSAKIEKTQKREVERVLKGRY